MLLLDVSHSTLNALWIKDITLHVSDIKESFGECLIRASWAYRILRINALFVELVHTQLFTPWPSYILRGELKVYWLRPLLVAFSGAKLVIIPLCLLHFYQFLFDLKADTKCLKAISRHELGRHIIGLNKNLLILTLELHQINNLLNRVLSVALFTNLLYNSLILLWHRLKLFLQKFSEFLLFYLLFIHGVGP